MSGTVQGNAFALLKAIYDQTGGDAQAITSSADAAKTAGLDSKTARAALGWLFGKGLLQDSREMAELPHVFITANGVDAVEGALAHPTRPTHHFPAVQNIINIQTFNGGAIQQGTTNSIQNVQTISQPPVNMLELARELARIRTELLKEASSPDDYIAVGRIAEAEKAASDQKPEELGKVVSSLGAVGRKVTDIAIRIGSEVAVSYLKSRLGIPSS